MSTTASVHQPPTAVRGTAEPVRSRLGAAVPLAQLVDQAGTLSLADRRMIVDQALVLLEDNYVHLPLKRAMHAVDPVQQLRLLRARLERTDEAAMEPEWRFHRELSEIFHGVRDLHTNYLLPRPFAGQVAFLPFLVEEFFESGRRRYLVSHVVQGYAAPGFAPGAEVTHWNGVPIARAVDRNADRFAGSNAAARRARGVESLTVRPLRMHVPPDEEWVTVSYIGTDDVEREVRESWLVAENLPAFADLDALTTTATAMGLDLEGDEVGRARKMLFAPQVVAAEERTEVVVSTERPAAGETVTTNMPGVFRAGSVATSSGVFGHIRIFTFGVDDPDAFVDEFVRLVELLPPEGLIIDVRGNGGGHIHASEFLLQTLTPRPIQPEPVQFVSTPLNRRICAQHADNPTGQIDLGPWLPSLEQATSTGAVYSAAFPITPVDGANAIGQRYHGPVVLITDARCYSATDIFAAGFADHGIGPILGVDDNTGAGGANVWTHGLLRTLLQLPAPDPATPYDALPAGADMRVSIRRTLRTGTLAGTPVEDLGVTPDERHTLTRRDLLQGNVDLLDRAGELLAAQPVRRLHVTVDSVGADGPVISAATTGIDRIDVYVDARPAGSVDVVGDVATLTLPGASGAGTVIRVEGFSDGERVAVRQLTA